MAVEICSTNMWNEVDKNSGYAIFSSPKSICICTVVCPCHPTHLQTRTEQGNTVIPYDESIE